uniref:Small ribosomal subunit protein uS12m n=1 Tax=Strigamia maritima TaxID=126957 RepID=T1JGF1_STRMM
MDLGSNYYGFPTPILTPSRFVTPLVTSLVTRVSELHCSAVKYALDPSEKQLIRMHRTGPVVKVRPKKSVLGGKPQMKGVVIRTLIKKPRKPNSANRKCVLLRLSNGKEAVAYVPGVGHNLQEHNVVLVEASRLQDVSGVKMKI